MLRIGNGAAWMRPVSLALAVTLGGCASMSGLGGLAATGEGQADGAAGSAQPQLVTLSPEETPPVPTRRPGKRPRVLQQAKAATATPAPATTGSVAAAQSGEPAKSEGGGFSLASLGSVFSSSSSAAPSAGEAEKADATPSGPDIVSIDQPPVGAYSLLAQRIKYCWLNATKPLLPNHGFFSELPPGEVREAKMIVYEKNAEGRRGTTVFAVDIAADSGGSTITSRNVRLEKPMEAGFKADLARWVKGDERCKA
jgi:hypothetical protein